MGVTKARNLLLGFSLSLGEEDGDLSSFLTLPLEPMPAVRSCLPLLVVKLRRALHRLHRGRRLQRPRQPEALQVGTAVRVRGHGALVQPVAGGSRGTGGDGQAARGPSSNSNPRPALGRGGGGESEIRGRRVLSLARDRKEKGSERRDENQIMRRE
ncbi:hypothetical protein GQ55_6G147700 [Panicum hallii var. hallii]|uniref:Uncharacterized protein n=1 Tax=Panicum hallii var. hallii TaxID=1504633 RepID=A0A2T7D683_9POAL|nr:hypothetical protein GQ55_6G147700 [Panicum hallii var. hallii]